MQIDLWTGQIAAITYEARKITGNLFWGLKFLICLMLYHPHTSLMQKRVDVLRYGTQECQSLKMKYFQDHSVDTARDAQVDDSHHQSSTVQYGAKHLVLN